MADFVVIGDQEEATQIVNLDCVTRAVKASSGGYDLYLLGSDKPLRVDQADAEDLIIEVLKRKGPA